MSSYIFEKGEFHEAELNNNDGDRCSLLHIRFPVCPTNTRIVKLQVLTRNAGSPISFFWIKEIKKILKKYLGYVSIC